MFTQKNQGASITPFIYYKNPYGGSPETSFDTINIWQETPSIPKPSIDDLFVWDNVNYSVLDKIQENQKSTVDLATIDTSLGLPNDIAYNQASTLGTESMLSAVAKNDNAMLNQGEQQFASQTSTPEQKSWWGSVKSWFSNLWGSEKQQVQESFQQEHTQVAQETRQKMQEVQTGESMTANFGGKTLDRREYYSDINLNSYNDRIGSQPMSEIRKFYEGYSKLIEKKADTVLGATALNTFDEFSLLKTFGYQKDGIIFGGTEAEGIYALTKAIIETQSRIPSMSPEQKLRILCDFNENGNVGETNTWVMDENKYQKLAHNPQFLRKLVDSIGFSNWEQRMSQNYYKARMDFTNALKNKTTGLPAELTPHDINKPFSTTEGRTTTTKIYSFVDDPTNMFRSRNDIRITDPRFAAMPNNLSDFLPKPSTRRDADAGIVMTPGNTEDRFAALQRLTKKLGQTTSSAYLSGNLSPEEKEAAVDYAAINLRISNQAAQMKQAGTEIYVFEQKTWRQAAFEETLQREVRVSLEAEAQQYSALFGDSEKNGEIFFNGISIDPVRSLHVGGKGKLDTMDVLTTSIPLLAQGGEFARVEITHDQDKLLQFFKDRGQLDGVDLSQVKFYYVKDARGLDTHIVPMVDGKIVEIDFNKLQVDVSTYTREESSSNDNSSRGRGGFSGWGNDGSFSGGGKSNDDQGENDSKWGGMG